MVDLLEKCKALAIDKGSKRIEGFTTIVKTAFFELPEGKLMLEYICGCRGDERIRVVSNEETTVFSATRDDQYASNFYISTYRSGFWENVIDKGYSTIENLKNK